MKKYIRYIIFFVFISINSAIIAFRDMVDSDRYSAIHGVFYGFTIALFFMLGKYSNDK